MIRALTITLLLYLLWRFFRVEKQRRASIASAILLVGGLYLVCYGLCMMRLEALH